MPIVRAGPRYLGLDYLVQADASNPEALVVTMARGDCFELRGSDALALLAYLDSVALPPPGGAPDPGTGQAPGTRVVRAHRVPLPSDAPAPAPAQAPEAGALDESV